jgi:hypothetical protein
MSYAHRTTQFDGFVSSSLFCRRCRLKFCTSLGATFSGADKVLANTIDQRQTEQRTQKRLLIAQTNRKKKSFPSEHCAFDIRRSAERSAALDPATFLRIYETLYTSVRKKPIDHHTNPTNQPVFVKPCIGLMQLLKHLSETCVS